ncbi:hypothetical protein OROMI_028876 [Orobanche minor]
MMAMDGIVTGLGASMRAQSDRAKSVRYFPLWWFAESASQSQLTICTAQAQLLGTPSTTPFFASVHRH